MISDQNRFKRAIILILVLFLISIELPYSDKSIIQYAVLFLSSKFVDGSPLHVTILWAIPLLFGWIWSFKEIVKSKKIKLNGLIIFIVIFMIFLPVTEKVSNIVRSSIYLFSDGVNSIEVVDSSLFYYDFSQEYEISLEVKMKLHNYSDKKVMIRLVLPSKLDSIFTETNFLFEQEINSYSDNIAIFRENIKLKLKKSVDLETLSNLNIGNLDYQIVFIDEMDERNHLRNDKY